MKTSVLLTSIILFAILLAPVKSYANENKLQKTEVERLFKWFPQCMRSDNAGVVESTIYDVVLLKKYHPEADYTRLINELYKVAENNSEPSIRFKAHLAIIYLNFSNNINIQPVKAADNYDYIYDQIAEQIKTKLVNN